jgi:hypothetical protein
MTQGLTQPLADVSTRNRLDSTGRPGLKADNFAVICESIFWKVWEPRRLTTLWASLAFYRKSFTF